jgi:hypothetical protein
MSDARQSDILLRLMRWRSRLERNHADREAQVRLQVIARAVDEIAELRRTNDKLRARLTALEHLIHTRGPPAFGREL